MDCGGGISVGVGVDVVEGFVLAKELCNRDLVMTRPSPRDKGLADQTRLQNIPVIWKECYRGTGGDMRWY